MSTVQLGTDKTSCFKGTVAASVKPPYYTTNLKRCYYFQVCTSLVQECALIRLHALFMCSASAYTESVPSASLHSTSS